jgi:hypothetical protein
LLANPIVVAALPPTTASDSVATGLAHALSPGANSENTTLPVGANPPVITAVSFTAPPTTTDGGAVDVPRVGVARVTVTGSAPHPLLVRVFAASPEYAAVQFHVPAELLANPAVVAAAAPETGSVSL